MYPLRRQPPAVEGDIPASGAWKPGDPVGDRRFATVSSGRGFALEVGGVLPEVTVAYETWGTLDANANNAILVCHALTGDAHAAGESGPGHRSHGWWDDLIGPGRTLDTDRFFVVCVNVLGGCQGTTGPSSSHPDDGRPWGPRFPVVTIRDIVRTQALLADSLGIGRWASVIGGSMGGMQVIEWGVMYPDRVASLISLASSAEASPWQVGWSQAGRLAIVQDPGWNDGFYYDAPDGHGPHRGLMLARRIAQIHYRSEKSFNDRFGRSTVEPIGATVLWDRFQVESYLDHHGQKLARRFDANSYLVLNKAMDLHDVGRGRGGRQAALGRVQAPTLVVAVDSDVIYPPRQQEQLAADLESGGAPVDYRILSSDHGHDGFLIEFEVLAPMVEDFLTTVLKESS